MKKKVQAGLQRCKIKCRFVFFSRLEIDYNIMVYNTSGVVVDCCFYKIMLFRIAHDCSPFLATC